MAKLTKIGQTQIIITARLGQMFRVCKYCYKIITRFT